MVWHAAKSVIGVAFAVAVLTEAANAGGFSRGSADTDILYDPGNFAMRAGVTFVSPTRKYKANAVPALVGTSNAGDYTIPSVAMKVQAGSMVSCAPTYTQAYGGHAEYAAPTISGKLREEFTVDEFGVTCAAKFAVGKGNFYLLGGGFQEHFDYIRTNNYGPGLNADLTLDGDDQGYRLGVAYDIPDIAFRAQLMYRSATSYGAEGTLKAPAGILLRALDPASPQAQQLNAALAAGLIGLGSQVPVDAIGVGNLPQTLELKLQTGIAPGWLAFGSVKWSDWSVQKSLDVLTLDGQEISKDLYNWKDGWTLTGGVGHAFNDRVSGLVSLTWDQGVSTGFDTSSDTYTVVVGGSVKDDFGGELRGGVGLTYITAGEETQYAPGMNAVTDNGWALAVSASYAVRF